MVPVRGHWVGVPWARCFRTPLLMHSDHQVTNEPHLKCVCFALVILDRPPYVVADPPQIYVCLHCASPQVLTMRSELNTSEPP
jgi:hypothetical protein